MGARIFGRVCPAVSSGDIDGRTMTGLEEVQDYFAELLDLNSTCATRPASSRPSTSRRS